MNENRTLNAHTRRIRHRRRLSVSHPNFQKRHRKLDRHLAVQNGRYAAFPASLSVSAITAGGTGYAVGDRFNVTGGTSTLAAVFQVTAVAAGVVTGVEPVQGGGYTVAPGAAAATTNVSGTGTGLTVTTALTGTPAASTKADVLASLARPPVGGVGAREQRNARSSQDVANLGIPIA